MDVFIPPRLKNRETQNLVCKNWQKVFCIFRIVIMLSLIQLVSIRDNLSPDSLGILGRIYLIETHSKTTISYKMMFVKDVKKRKSAQGNALMREIFHETHILLQKEKSSQILFQNFCTVLWKVHLCELVTSQLCIPLSGKCLKYAFILLLATVLAKYRNLSKNCYMCTDRYLFWRESGDRMQYTSVLVGKFLLHIQTRVMFLCNWWQILLGKLGIYTSKKSLQRFLSIYFMPEKLSKLWLQVSSFCGGLKCVKATHIVPEILSLL